MINDDATSSSNTVFNLRDSNTSHETFQINNNPEMIVLHELSTKQRTENDKDDSDSDFSENDRTIMSAFWKNGKFAASYFNAGTSELFVLNEISDSVPEHNMLKNIYMQVRPSMIIVESRSPKTFINSVKSIMNENGLAAHFMCDIRENSQTNAGFHLLPSKEYNYESCKNRVYQISLPNEPKNASHHDHELFLNSIINFRYIQTIHATGALLKYLDKNWCFINTNSDKLDILAVNIVSLDKIVTINDETYRALQIFNKLSHPSNFKKGMASSCKEGLSMYSVFNRCCSKIGMQYLRLLLQQPTKDLKTIQRRLDTIMFCNKPGNEEIVKSLCSSLKYIKNVNGIMTRIKTLRASPYEWKQLFNTLYNAVLICEICENYNGCSSLIDALGSRNNDNLFQVAYHMNRVIDFEVSNVQGKFTVKSGIDPKLDEKKQIMIGLHGLMSSTAKFELEKLPSYVEECTMVYLPNLGYLLGIKMWKETLNAAEKKIPNLKFMFQNDDCIYYKSEGCNELDNLIGDTYPEILAHEMRIMTRLTHFILQHLHSLSTVVKLCAELDCIISMAKVCKDNDYKRPTLSFERIINIKQGRHPLQEMCVENYVPNDTNASNGNGMVTVLTGPNSCGKSIYLKQIAVIVYMAHIGCYVPAESATIGLIDHIFTRIQTVEDISTRMSAFMIDLRQISQALHYATSSSLIIIDEFGKGTTEVDGLGLLAACVNNFLFQDNNCPHVFVSTHFHSLKEYLIESQQLKLMSMEYIIQNEKLVFLYRIMDGATKESFAHRVAEDAGISKTICSRAKIIFDNLQVQYPQPNKTLNKLINQQKIINNMKNLLINKKSINKNSIIWLTK